jgi:phage terminase large subunit
LRDRFYNTYLAVVKGEYINPDDMISLSSDIEQLDLLRSEVCRIPLKPNGNGYIQIMNKLDMAKLDIASPNMSDAMMMALLVPKIIPDTSNIDFDGW